MMYGKALKTRKARLRPTIGFSGLAAPAAERES
jgi:hypothetical protein